MSEPVVTSSEMALLLGLDASDGPMADRLDALIWLAQELCESVVSPCPPAARAVVISVAARAFYNPQNVVSDSETVAVYSHNVNYGPSASGGIYLTKQDRSTLRRLVGRSGAFSINTMPSNAGVGRLPVWDQSRYVLGTLTGALQDFFYDDDGNPTMAYTPPSMNLTQISGAVVPVSASGTLQLGRETEVTGSAAVSLAFSATVNGSTAGVKVSETYTGSGVTVTGTFLGGATSFTMVAGQENKFTWDGAAVVIS